MLILLSAQPSYRRDDVNSIRSFLLTLVASLVLLGFTAYYATGFVTGLIFSDEDAVTTPDSNDNSLPISSANRSMVNLLLVCTDQYTYRPSAGGAVESQFNLLADAELRNHTTNIEFLTLVSFNRSTNQVMITALPDNLFIQANGQRIDLNTAYYFSQNQLYGLSSDFFVESISALFGLQIDYAGYVDIDDYVTVAKRLNGIVINSPIEVPEAGIVMGEQVMNSTQLYTMLKKTDYADPTVKTQLIANQCQAILERITDDAHRDTAYTDFDRISKVLTTDFTKADLSECISLIFSYSEFTVQMPLVIGEHVVWGETVYFAPDRTATQTLFKQYK